MSATRGVRRRAGLDANPLTRRGDRIEAAVRTALIAALVLLILAVSWSVGVYVYHQNARVELAQHRDRQATPARLLSAARPATAIGTSTSDPASALASWSAPDGSPRRGQIRVRAGLAAGSVTTIWTDAGGRLVPPPRSHQDALSATLFAVFMTIFSMAAVSASFYWLAGRGLEWRRHEQWQREWRRVGPEWSRQP